MKIFGYILILFFILFGIFLYFFIYSDTEAQTIDVNSSGGVVNMVLNCNYIAKVPASGMKYVDQPLEAPSKRKWILTEKLYAKRKQSAPLLQIMSIEGKNPKMVIYNGPEKPKRDSCFIGKVTTPIDETMVCCDDYKMAEHLCYRIDGKYPDYRFKSFLADNTKFTNMEKGSCMKNSSYSKEVNDFINKAGAPTKNPYNNINGLLDRIKFGNR